MPNTLNGLWRSQSLTYESVFSPCAKLQKFSSVRILQEARTSSKSHTIAAALFLRTPLPLLIALGRGFHPLVMVVYSECCLTPEQMTLTMKFPVLSPDRGLGGLFGIVLDGVGL